jgi:hypothetical protein
MAFRSVAWFPGIEELRVAGRCISVDETAFGSTHDVPASAMTDEAAAVPPSAAAAGTMPPAGNVTEIQNRLRIRRHAQCPGLFSDRFREQHRFRGNHPHR